MPLVQHVAAQTKALHQPIIEEKIIEESPCDVNCLRGGDISGELEKMLQSEIGQQFKEKVVDGDYWYQACQLKNERSNLDIKLPLLSPINNWKSMKRDIPEEAISIVTQLSIDRLGMLQAQCSRWPRNRIAAALYMPYVSNFGALSFEKGGINGSSLGEMMKMIDEFHRYFESCPSRECCALDLEFVVETYDTIEDINIKLYPVNAMRNRALLLSRTDIVFLLDADFVPSLSTSYVGQREEFAKLNEILANNSVVVVPAFEMKVKTEENSQQNDTNSSDNQYQSKQSDEISYDELRDSTIDILKNGKQMAVEAYNTGKADGFHLENWWQGLSFFFFQFLQ